MPLNNNDDPSAAGGTHWYARLIPLPRATHLSATDAHPPVSQLESLSPPVDSPRFPPCVCYLPPQVSSCFLYSRSCAIYCPPRSKELAGIHTRRCYVPALRLQRRIQCESRAQNCARCAAIALALTCVPFMMLLSIHLTLKINDHTLSTKRRIESCADFGCRGERHV